MGLHRRWVVRFWPYDNKDDVEWEVFPTEKAARGHENSLAPHGFDAEVYQLLNPNLCRHCDRGDIWCQCENDE